MGRVEGLRSNFATVYRSLWVYIETLTEKILIDVLRNSHDSNARRAIVYLHIYLYIYIRTYILCSTPIYVVFSVFRVASLSFKFVAA